MDATQQAQALIDSIVRRAAEIESDAQKLRDMATLAQGLLLAAQPSRPVAA